MTDNDIIKALDICQNENSMCSDCCYSDDYTNCNTRIAKDALEIIYRQKAKIENQREEIKRLHKCLLDVNNSRNHWKAKACRIGKQLQQGLEDRRKEDEWK